MLKEKIIKIAENLIKQIGELHDDNSMKTPKFLVEETYNFLKELNINTNKWFYTDNENCLYVLNIRDKKDKYKYLPFEDTGIVELVINDAIWTALKLNNIDFDDNGKGWIY